MNSLIQAESYLIGSSEDIKKLENAQSAKLLVISDSHGNYDILSSIITNYGDDCNALFFAGDGTEDLCSFLENATSDKDLANHLPPVIAIVKGNCDKENFSIYIDDDERNFHFPYTVTAKIAGRTILLVHGNIQDVDLGTETLANMAYKNDGDMVFFGHTHKPYWEEIMGTLILNPGSCAKPRGNYPPTFAIVSYPGETDRYCVEYFKIEGDGGIFNDYAFSPISVESSANLHNE